MKTLEESYRARKLNEIVTKATVMREARERHDGRMVALNETLSLIYEEKIDSGEAKKIAKAVSRLESVLEKFGGESGQLPNISKMISGVVGELNAYQGAGWWDRLKRSLSSSNNPLAKAAALETLLSSGMELVGTLLDQQGKKLTDDPLSDQDGPASGNVVAALKKAFDPGHTSSLSGLAGGKLNQLLGLKGSIGDMFANDLANLKPSQLRAFAQEVRSVGAPPPADVAATTGGPEASAPTGQAGQSQSTQGTTSRNTPEDGPIETGDEGGDPEHSVSQQLNGMNSALKKRDARGALYWAASALQKLQMSPDQALKVFKPTTK